MTSFRFLCIQVLAVAVAVSGFSAGTFPITRRGSRLCAKPSSCDGQMSDAVHASNQLQQKIRPVLLSTAAAASVFASLPTVVHADTTSMNQISSIHTTITPSNSVIVPSTQYSNAMATSSMQLAASTLESPIGEMQDGSENSAAKSFGQWFTLLYIVVSLLAGGKEMLKRAQNQLNKDE